MANWIVYPSWEGYQYCWSPAMCASLADNFGGEGKSLWDFGCRSINTIYATYTDESYLRNMGLWVPEGANYGLLLQAQTRYHSGGLHRVDLETFATNYFTRDVPESGGNYVRAIKCGDGIAVDYSTFGYFCIDKFYNYITGETELGLIAPSSSYRFFCSLENDNIYYFSFNTAVQTQDDGTCFINFVPFYSVDNSNAFKADSFLLATYDYDSSEKVVRVDGSNYISIGARNIYLEDK